MIRFRHLQALHAVIETGTVTQAAEALGVSQPAISNLLSQIEGQTNLTLFLRNKGRLSPTPEAMVLARDVEKVVRGMGQVEQTVADLQNQRAGQLQVACTHALAFGFMPNLIAGFLADMPDVSVSLQTRYSRNIQEWVAADLFEIGVSELPIEDESLHQEVMSFECQCAVPEDSPFADHQTLTPEILDNAPFVVMGQDHMTHHRTKEAFLAAGARWRTRVETHLFRSLLDFVKQGVGVALIDPFTLAHDDGCGYVVRPFAPVVQIDMALIRARNRPMSRLGAAFAAHLKNEMMQQAIQ